jgi:spore coat protein U-like protein
MYKENRPETVKEKDMTAFNKTRKIAFLALVFGTIFSIAMASAATEGTLVLQGTVPGILEITVNAEPGHDTLDLSLNAADVKVATIVERSNKKAGYTVTLESANALVDSASTGVFKNTDPAYPDYSLGYTISYAGTAITLSSGSAVISDVSGKTSGSGESKDVAISYNGADEFPYEGTYTDTLTFTIAAK